MILLTHLGEAYMKLLIEYGIYTIVPVALFLGIAFVVLSRGAGQDAFLVLAAVGAFTAVMLVSVWRLYFKTKRSQQPPAL
jgi:hypothetical protein